MTPAKKNPQSLRALATDLGVSASYLSQVRHGKRPASQRLLSMSSKVLSTPGIAND
jgi:transcriptional regulator with XRE-family HTH domain